MALKRVLSVIAFAMLLFSPPLYMDGYPLAACGIDKIYQVGDSISDSGNLIRESPLGAATPFARLPYGETTLGIATGRCSNGLLIIDFLAMAAGLPLINPYKNSNANFRNGVNFAVAGSTAISSPVLLNQNIRNPVTNSSLDVQLDWMANHFKSTCDKHKDCTENLKTALFMVGEIGGNDYNYAFFQNKTFEQVEAMIPQVVNSIKDAVKRVIHFGAKKVVVPGNFPIGCLPIYLTSFQTKDSTAYDEQNCLKGLNDFAKTHNEQLLKAIQELQDDNPTVTIHYADYYRAYHNLLRNAASLGFELQKACCGKGGKYNFNLAETCGYPDVNICADPGRYVSWDGIHSTEAAYKIMSDWLVDDILWKFGCFP